MVNRRNEAHLKVTKAMIPLGALHLWAKQVGDEDLRIRVAEAIHLLHEIDGVVLGLSEEREGS